MNAKIHELDRWCDDGGPPPIPDPTADPPTPQSVEVGRVTLSVSEDRKSLVITYDCMNCFYSFERAVGLETLGLEVGPIPTPRSISMCDDAKPMKGTRGAKGKPFGAKGKAGKGEPVPPKGKGKPFPPRKGK